MAFSFSATSLAKQFKTLLADRARHEAEINRIDSTLARIESAFGTPAKRGPKPGSKRRKRGSFGVSGEESVVAFVKKAGTPTTKEVNKHWKAEGRGGTADNTLTKLVKLKKLKRINLVGQRGSKYTA
jgi:hypothetical protein